jgi:sodium transport system permease protein
MNLRHVLHVFRKDGLEILRDRRTLFVNVVLPALLYPFIALFMVQVVQLTKSQQVTPPRVTLIDLPQRLGELLDQADPDDGEAEAAIGEAPPAATAVELPQRSIIALRTAALELAAVEATEPHDRAPGSREREHRLRAQLLERLRADDLAGVVVNVPRQQGGSPRWFATYDNAHRYGDRAQAAVFAATERYRRELVLTRLRDAGLEEGVLRPLTLESRPLAPLAESVRTRLAGIIPLLLVILAAVGAFYPAIDLIAGERERGTLESLLSWPVNRRDLFLGKLLVTCVAAAGSVILNLSSLAVTAALAGRQLAAAGADLGDAVSTGFGTLALCFAVLLPLTLTLGALSLALAGVAASAKEAQNYLSPLLLVVLVAALVAAVPDTRPNLALDLIPITGSVLALKECLQGQALPWFHLLISTGAAAVVAAVVVSWATRLLDNERFCYPGLVRAGWGRFRRWGSAPATPDGMEVMAVYAVAVAGMTLGASAFLDLPTPLVIAGPLVLFVALPALLHCWLGAYRPSTVLGLADPGPAGAARAAAAIPFAILLSSAIGALQPEPPPADTTAIESLIADLRSYGVVVELLVLALLPALCEELLCRGTLLSGLTRGTGAIGGVLLSSFLFASLHLSPYRFLPQLVLGVALALLALRYRSIIPCIVLHAGHNAGVLMIDRTGGVAALEQVPPLAALGIGVLGLWALIVLPGRAGRRAE